LADEQRLVLASESPRRRELLARLVDGFEVQVCPLDEPRDRPESLSAAKWAESLAHYKARAVAEANSGRWVLGADTAVACEGRLLGKPTDEADARSMLELQAGRVSEVITGLALVRLRGDEEQRRLGHDVTRVWMRDSRAEREAYLASGEWRGKAGAYGIQDVGDRLIERIEGSFSNVVGLPLERVGAMLAAEGIACRGAGGAESRSNSDARD
jgi:septum formation protein